MHPDVFAKLVNVLYVCKYFWRKIAALPRRPPLPPWLEPHIACFPWQNPDFIITFAKTETKQTQHIWE